MIALQKTLAEKQVAVQIGMLMDNGTADLWRTASKNILAGVMYLAWCDGISIFMDRVHSHQPPKNLASVYGDICRIAHDALRGFSEGYEDRMSLALHTLIGAVDAHLREMNKRDNYLIAMNEIEPEVFADYRYPLYVVEA